MKLRFVSHASIEIEEQDAILLTDPWCFGDIFNNSWELIAPPDLEKIDFARLRHITISHEHPDHLHFPTLRAIRKRTRGPVTVYYPRQDNPNVRDVVTKLGFEVVELIPHEETEIGPGLSITNFPTRQDAAQVIRAGGRVILNQNDCQLEPGEVSALKRIFPRIDAMFLQFSLAGYYANADDPAGMTRAQEKHLRLIKEYTQAFQPSVFVPYASFVRFCKETNAFGNHWGVTPDEVIEALPDLPTQILYSGDYLLWEDWESRNVKNLARWREAFHAPLRLRPHEPVEESEILQAGEALVKEGEARELWPFRPPETHLEIRETGRAAAIDFRKGRMWFLNRPDPAKLAGRLPAEMLLCFLKLPWGADTLHITACFHVTHSERWRSLLRFRHSLYLGTEKDKYRQRGLAWLTGRLARGVWNRSRRVLSARGLWINGGAL